MSIVNIYGPTEITVCSSKTPIESSAEISIGKPIANTQIYILDKNLRPLPIGAVGELCISGDGVGRGYLNRPELTAEKFIPNPFLPDKTMYKTGDLAKWREDGNLEYVGRMDNQVKIRGLRVELGEIEAAVSACDGIKKSAVTVKTENGKQYICAYYIGENADINAVKTEISKKLPKYMLPHFFIQLENFPQTPSGKTDYKAFPAPDFGKAQAETEYIAPVTESEKTVIALMQEVLNVQKIGMNDNFFDIGGDSLSVIEFVSKAHYKGICFSLQDVFNYPTPALLLENINSVTSGAIPETDDYSDIHALLSHNRISGTIPEKQSLGDVLITGATGWLGAHILDEFLSAENGSAYCLVRGASAAESRDRLNAVLANYFGEKHTGYKRIIPVCGDICDFSVEAPINTIIHCAANVKHYGDYKQSHDTNVKGTENIIALARQKGAKLIHISTITVSGFGFGGNTAEAAFDETKLYIGQSLENVYVRSKFEAEAAVLRAKLAGLDAAVIRVGNLSNRYSDYKFQENHESNSILARIKSFADLGLYPSSMANFPIEFSPADITAKAIIKLAQHSGEFSMFHAYNEAAVPFAEFAKALNAANIKMEAVLTDKFIQAVRDTANIPEKSHIYELLIHIMDESGNLLFQNNTTHNDFTDWFLKQIGFTWQKTDSKYLCGYIGYFKGKGVFS